MTHSLKKKQRPWNIYITQFEQYKWMSTYKTDFNQNCNNSHSLTSIVSIVLFCDNHLINKLFYRHLAHYVLQIKASFIYTLQTVPIHRQHLKTHCPSF